MGTLLKKVSFYPAVDARVKEREREDRKNKVSERTLEQIKIGLELCERLSKIPFWCGDNKLHLKNPEYHTKFCCMSHVVRLPRHPATREEMPLTPYQVNFVNRVIEATKAPTLKEFKKKFKEAYEEFIRTAHFFHVNKGRQMGFTEIILRLIQFFCFTRYAGNKVGIIAGTNGNLAKKDLRRFAALFNTISLVVEQWVTGMYMKLVNGTEVEAFKATEEAITGGTEYKCIFMDEAAKWRTNDDTPVFNSVVPIVDAAGGDLFLNSTPKGPMKMFHEISEDKESIYIKFVYSILECVGNLYTEKEVKLKLKQKHIDTKQEYMNKFSATQDSILGSITDEDRGKGWVEWGEDEIQNDSDYDDDSYPESQVDEFDWTD